MSATVNEQVERKHPLAKCEECPLFPYDQCAPSQLPTGKAKAAIVSRSPGRHDVQRGGPFTGPSGPVLDHLLKQNGIEREELLITNVVLCSPIEGKVPPTAIEACAPRLKDELAGIDLIVAAGTEACASLIGRGSIDSLRGYRIARGNRTVVATNNPALVLRDDSTFPNLVKDFKRAFHPIPEPKMPKVELIEDAETAIKYLDNLDRTHTGIIAADIESRGGLTHKATLVSLQLSTESGRSIVFGERQDLFQNADFVQGRLRPFLESKDRSFVWHNGIFDTKILRSTYGIQARVDEDTMLLSWALDERGGKDGEGSYHSLDYLLMEEFGWPHYVPGSVQSFKKTGRLVSEAQEKDLRKEYRDENRFNAEFKALEAKNYIALYKYAGYDAAGTFQLFEYLRDRAVEDEVYDKPYKESLLRYEDFLREMETNGMAYDYNRASELLEKEVEPELANIIVALRARTGKELLKPSSPQQMAALYYDDWQIMHDMRNRPDMNRSVDDSARKEIIDGRFTFKGEYEYLREANAIVTKRSPEAAKEKKKIQLTASDHDRFQKLNKQAGTYLRSLIARAEEDPDSRIYTTLPRHATATGRLASRGPNLQNVTRTKEGLPDIRGLFYAPDGRMVVNADYSQAELRAIAALSGDTVLVPIYTRGESLHKLTAERFYGPNYTPENYSNSKNMNFGVFYRQSADTFLEKHEIPVAEAQKYIDWVWSTFTGVKEWEKSIEYLVHKNVRRNYTYVESPFGHRRRFYLITDENKNACYREAINFLPQNIAANITLHACAALYEEVDRQRAKLCLQVHDSIYAEVEEDYVDEYKTICEQVMVSLPKSLLGWTIPFEVEIGVGKTWGSAK